MTHGAFIPPRIPERGSRACAMSRLPSHEALARWPCAPRPAFCLPTNPSSELAQWLACWAHNPKVPGSKPGSAKVHDFCDHEQHASWQAAVADAGAARPLCVTWPGPLRAAQTCSKQAAAGMGTSAEWRSGQRVGLITQRSQDRNLAPLRYTMSVTMSPTH